MKLLKLSCNNPKFKTLIFKPNLNIVAGLQLSDEDKQTINGIGKSLTLILIHLMFGGKLDPKKTARVEVLLRNIIPEKITELREDKKISWDNKENSFFIDVGPGDVRVVKIEEVRK